VLELWWRSLEFVIVVAMKKIVRVKMVDEEKMGFEE